LAGAPDVEAPAMKPVEEKPEPMTKVLHRDDDVDTEQKWGATDPVIPEDRKGSVWVALFKCPDGHKTKATSDYRRIRCRVCEKVATIMPGYEKKGVR
jgi:hypothetical protein